MFINKKKNIQKENPMKNFKSLGLIIIMALLVIGCSKTKTLYETIPIYIKETKIEKEILRDTVIDVQIKEVFVQNETRDTISELSTPNAYSLAKYLDGVLFHTLEQKGTQPTKVVYKDKFIFDTVNITQVRTIEKEKEIGWWNKLFIWSGRILFILCGLGLIYLILRNKLKK